VKDYKPRPRGGVRRLAGGTLIGIFIGLVLGLALASGVAIYMTNAPVPFVNRGPEKAKAAAPQADRNLAERTAEAKGGTPERPKFDFYKILPGQEEPVTERELKAAAKGGDRPGAPADLYFVQAGAFQNPADADNLKARLALIGLIASVEPASLPDRGTWYRVRLGPYHQLEELNRVRATLAQNGVDASLVRIKN
jgi:cell division protein FtsN